MSINIGGNTISNTATTSSGSVSSLTQYELPTTGLLFHVNGFNFTGANTWYDCVQNIPLNLAAGTVPPRTTQSNIPCLQFNGSGYYESSTANGQACDMSGEFTLVMTIYCVTPSGRTTIFEKIPNTYSSYEQEIACTWETNNTISWYTNYSSYDYASTQAMTNNSWNLIAITTNSNRTAGYYWQSGSWNSNFVQRSSNQVVLANGIRLGSGYAGTVPGGYLHSCLIYGVSLNQTTMQQVANYYTNLFSLAGTSIAT
jgi:hypothetical protein